MYYCKWILFSLTAFFLLSCVSSQQHIYQQEQTVSQTEKKAVLYDYALLKHLPQKAISYEQQIKPLLARRCVVCHACYDAPCQLKLSSMAGIQRGASKQVVYNPTRLQHAKPQRLFIDAQTTTQWRQRGFFPVLNETHQSAASVANTQHIDAQLNLERSLLYQMVHLKQSHPQPIGDKLDEHLFSFALDRKAYCPKRSEFEDFARRYPQWGMPYAMPNLRPREYQTLVSWIAQGSPDDSRLMISPPIRAQIHKWEAFLNHAGNKWQLVSRYLYEHLFQADLIFATAGQGTTSPVFFRLVRSRTPPGDLLEEIATTRPYDKPNTRRVYYRFRVLPGVPIRKSHKVYYLNDQKLARFQELFITPDYQVNSLPDYDSRLAANPLKTFQDIPALSRYRFLLDDAYFFIEGFIKGPVCRGQIALNVIEDYFWVFFISPEKSFSTINPAFLRQNLDYFHLPAEQKDTLNLFAVWSRYWKQQKHYLRAKIKAFEQLPRLSIQQALDDLWDGSSGSKAYPGDPAQSALTVFRHFDSASVAYGMLDTDGVSNGKGPETAWILDYPLFERIHYLLVAGFDVYGNVGHQLNTRLYMDFLRMEGEDNFLALLPPQARKVLRDEWYQGIRQDMQQLLDMPMDWLAVKKVYGFQQTTPHALKQELYQYLRQKFAPMDQDFQRHNYGRQWVHAKRGLQLPYIKAMVNKINQFHGNTLQYVPEVTFIRIRTGQGQLPVVLTVLNNKAYKHLNTLFDEDNSMNRDYQNDSLLALGWLEGAYPNFFLDLQYKEIPTFLSDFVAIQNEQDFEKLVSLYGVRRSNPDFWSLSDWFYEYQMRAHPLRGGLFDLNRYENY